MQRTNEFHSGGVVMTERVTKKQIEESLMLHRHHSATTYLKSLDNVLF